MRVSDTAIRRPVATAMVVIGLIVFGVISINRMRVDLFPNVTLPVVAVATIYPGAGPLEVESEVTEIMERQLGTIPNLREITSRSFEGVSVIMLQFEWGTNLDAASSDIRDRIDMAQAFLPDDANKPFVVKFDPSMMPVVNLTLTGNIDETELREIGEEIRTSLQRVAGVASVGVAGGAKRQVQITVDLRRLAQAGITNEQFIAALKAQNLNFPVGSVSTKEQRYLVRLIGQYDDLEGIKNTTIGNKGGVPILVRDVATVAWQPKEKKAKVRMNGTNCVFLWVQRRPDANTVSVANAIRSEIEKIKPTLPAGVNLQIFWDSSESIKRSVGNVATNLVLGGLLASIVLFLFLRRFRPTLFVVFAIPISIFFALFLMYIFGFTINILSMAGLAIAVGMVVDNGIVVFESIFRHRESGEEPATAASSGVNEVAMAITASTLTTIAVFLPLLLLRGLIQVFFRELSWAIIFALSASLGVAITLIPMLASRFLKLRPAVSERGILRWSERFYQGLENFYAKAIDWAIRHRKLVISGTVLLFVVTLGIINFLGSEFMPVQQMRHSTIYAEMPVGSNLEITNRAVAELEKYIVAKWGDDIEGLSVQVGSGASYFAAIFGGARSNSAEIDLILKKKAKHTLKEIENDIRKKAAEIPGLSARTEVATMTSFFGGGAPIQVDIIGHDLAIADSLAQLVMQTIETIPGVVDVKSNREKGEPEIQLVVDRKKAALYGLSPYQIGSALRTQIEGNVATQYRMKGKEYDILIRLAENQRDAISKIVGSTINSPFGPVLLKNVVRIQTGTSPLEVQHKNTERIVSITANAVGQSSGRLAGQVSRVIGKIVPPPGFEIKVTGSYEEMIKSFKDIAFAVFIAMLLVFMVMAAQFESFRDPFIIMFTIPLAIIGVIWALFITGTTLSVISGIGVLVLVGIVVNNGIVYIDYVNQLRRKRGMSLEEAVKYGGKIRMRPILMTALTTIFGLLPLALKIGEGSELWSPLGRAVIGGMIVATFLTLIFIPVLYTSFEKGAEKRRKKAL
ncbi:MAG: efflux RND transporter permease subunit [candidate division WOR-3 bacterium]